MADEPLLLDVRDNIAEIVINRPEKLNAINPQALGLFEEYIERIERDRLARVIIVRGEGRAFCAGTDLSGVADGLDDHAKLDDYAARWHRVFMKLSASPVPSIAAVHGIAFAGGFEVMLACDFAVLADDARIGDQHVNIGGFPGGGSSQRLPRLIGERRAKWLILSGEEMPPQEALQSGLVNAVVPASEVLTRAREMAAKLASKSPVSMSGIKRVMRLGMAVSDIETALQIEQGGVLRHLSSKDIRIGLEAYKNRTPPEFIGE